MIITKKDGGGKTRLIPEPVKCHFDYLRISVSIETCKFYELLQYCDGKYIGVIPEKRWSAGGNATYYDNSIVSPNGIRGGYTDNKETEKIDVMIEFSGQYFESITVEDTWRLCIGLKHSFNVKCNRLDIAIDDVTYTIIPVEQMIEACQQENNFSFRNYERYEKHVIGKDRKVTDYFGSRNSGKLVRIYDHDGDCHRFEAEFKKSYAVRVFDFFASIERPTYEVLPEEFDTSNIMLLVKDNFAKLIGDKDICANIEKLSIGLHGCKDWWDIMLQRILASIAVTAIDFRDKSVRDDRQRASRKDTQRLNFYQEFMDKVGCEIKLKLPTVKRCMRKTVAWMQRSVSPSLSIVADGLGAENFYIWLLDLLSKGRKRQSNYHLKIIQLIKDNNGIVSLT